MPNFPTIIVLLKGNINYDSRVQKQIATFLSLGLQVSLVVWNWESISYNNKVEIIDINLSNHKLPHGAIFTFIKILKFWYISANIIKKRNYDYVHCNDLDTLGILYFLPNRYHKFIIYDAHELFPEQFSRKNIRYWVWNYIERQLIKKISTVIVPEVNRANYLKEKYKLQTNPHVICNFPNYQKITPKNIRKIFNISNKQTILCYQGRIGPDRMIEIIIESLKCLPRDYVLIFFGYAFGNYLNDLQVLLTKLRLTDRVFFFGQVPPQEILPTIAQSDVGIALYENKGINNYFCASNKVFDHLMAGTKIITNNYPPLQILRRYKFVRLISEVNPKSLAECVIDLVKEPCIISDKVKRRFSWESFTPIFKDIYT